MPDALEAILAGARISESPVVLLDTYERMTALGGYLRRGLLPSLPERDRDRDRRPRGTRFELVRRWLGGRRDRARARGVRPDGLARPAGQPRPRRRACRGGRRMGRGLAARARAGGRDGSRRQRLDARDGRRQAGDRPLADPAPGRVRAERRPPLGAQRRRDRHGSRRSTCSGPCCRTATRRPSTSGCGALTFTEPLGDGLTLHDLVRRALHADLRRRDQERERELRRRIVDHLYERARGRRPADLDRDGAPDRERRDQVGIRLGGQRRLPDRRRPAGRRRRRSRRCSSPGTSRSGGASRAGSSASRPSGWRWRATGRTAWSASWSA